MSPIVRRPYRIADAEDPGDPTPRPDLARIPWQELGIGQVEDFTTTMWDDLAGEPNSRTSRMFLAEVIHEGRKVGSFYHVAAMSASALHTMVFPLSHSIAGMRNGAYCYDEYSWCLGLTVDDHHFRAFKSEDEGEDPLVDFRCQPCERMDGFLGYFDHGVWLDLTPDDFRRIDDGYRRLLALVRPHLPEIADYGSGEHYADLLRRTGRKPEPLLREVMSDVGAGGHVDFMRRNQIAKILRSALTASAPLSWLAVAQAAEAIGAPAPAIGRREDGALIDQADFRALLDAYIAHRCPWLDETIREEPKAASSAGEGGASPDGADFLRDRTTSFRLYMDFMVEDLSSSDAFYEDPFSKSQKVPVTFELVVPEDSTQPAWLEFQIDETAHFKEVFAASGLIPGKDGFCPRSRRLPAEGLREIFAWLDAVNIWEWQPPSPIKLDGGKIPPEAPWAPLVELDARYQHGDSWIPDYQNQWFLEVSRGGRCFRQLLDVFGAPAPSAYAFDEGSWAPVPTRSVPILANHLAFLTHDPILVGLTKRLFRLLPRKKPRPQVARFDDGEGTRYEVDFDRMVARRIRRHHGFGLGRLGILAPKLTEVPITEYDRMRLWGSLLAFKRTDAGLAPTQTLDGSVDAEPTPPRRGRTWSGDVCDGKRRARFLKGRLTEDDEGLRRRFVEGFTALFAVADRGAQTGPLPLLALPKSRHVAGGIPPQPPELSPGPLYQQTIEERLRNYRSYPPGRFDGMYAWAGAVLGDVECMMKAKDSCWEDEAASLGNPEAMVIVANRILGVVGEKCYSLEEKKDPGGLARRYYEGAYKAGYLPAALGMGYLSQHGIGGPVDVVAAVAYYLEALGEASSAMDKRNLFAYTALRDLHGDKRGPVYDLVESHRYAAMVTAIIAESDLEKKQREAKLLHYELERQLKAHQTAMAKLTAPVKTERLLPHPWAEYEVGRFDDFSTFISAGPATPSEGVYVPIFCAELLFEGQAVGSLFCINLSSAKELTGDTWAGVRASGHHTRFIIHKSAASQAMSDGLEIGRREAGVYKTKHRLLFDRLQAVSGTPEWGRNWAAFREMTASLRSRLGDPADPRHPARRRYLDHLKEAGLEPDPFIKGLLPQVGSVGHAEMLRRHEVCRVLARTLNRHEPLSDLAVKEAVQATGRTTPAMDRQPDGSWSPQAHQQLRSLAEAYLAKMFPCYWSLDTFMEAHKQK